MTEWIYSAFAKGKPTPLTYAHYGTKRNLREVNLGQRCAMARSKVINVPVSLAFVAIAQSAR